jgi:hypothetical protein
MVYRLAGIGDRLGGPVFQAVELETLDQAVRAAEELLNTNVDCECVEIFHGNRFLGEVDRLMAG